MTHEAGCALSVWEMALVPFPPVRGRVVHQIHRYLPTVYTDQMVVKFECGCWQGSRSPHFNYDCQTHKGES